MLFISGCRALLCRSVRLDMRRPDAIAPCFWARSVASLSQRSVVERDALTIFSSALALSYHDGRQGNIK